MKTFILVLAILGLVGAGYFYSRSQQETSIETPAETLDSQNDSLPPAAAAPAQIAVFENADYGFRFDYRIKPFGYSIFENNTEQNLELETFFGVTLVRSDDYNASVQAAAEGNAHDGPPSMSLYIFSAQGVSDLETWLVENRMITNCNEGEVGATMLADADASSCLWDGLYPGVTVAHIRDNKIYVLVGTRESSETIDGYSYEKDFNELVESFAFTN